jgi:hypothetical protein
MDCGARQSAGLCSRLLLRPIVGLYAFYALQPYILSLYGNNKAFTIAGFMAAVVACVQIAGGFAAPYIRKLVKRLQ